MPMFRPRPLSLPPIVILSCLALTTVGFTFASTLSGSDADDFVTIFEVRN